MGSGTFYSQALSISDAGQVAGLILKKFAGAIATRWSNGQAMELGAGIPSSINDAGQVVGFSIEDGYPVATEWSNGQVITFGDLSGLSSQAIGINDAGQVVGYITVAPESSTWTMMLLGFAGLGFAGYRSTRSSF